MLKRFVWELSILAVVLTGCGYTTGSLLPPNLQSIYIEPFKNSIDFTSDTNRELYEPLLEVKVRQAISDRFLFDGNLRPGTQEMADLKLQGELISFERGDLRLDASNNVQEYRLNIIVRLTMWDVEKDGVRWSENAFAGEATYFVSGASAISESAAIQNAVNDLARRVVERTIEDW